jgi:hypothetical protein
MIMKCDRFELLCSKKGGLVQLHYVRKLARTYIFSLTPQLFRKEAESKYISFPTLY